MHVVSMERLIRFFNIIRKSNKYHNFISPSITFKTFLQLHIEVQRLLSSSELSEPQSGSASRAKQTSFPPKHAALPWFFFCAPMGSPQPLLLLPLVLSDSVDEWSPEEHETRVPTAHVTHEIYCPMISYDHPCILLPAFNMIHHVKLVALTAIEL